nr:hypothetical protein HUO10_004796 [Paraburkholderia busanensis]
MSQAITSSTIQAALTSMTEPAQSTPGTANAGAAEKFQALMDQPPLSPPAAQHGGDGTVFSQMVSTYDAAAQHAMNHITEFAQQSGNMDVKQVIAESAQAAMEMYQVQFDFQAKMSVVSSSKSSAETLMKNQ